jgi:chromosome segregation ATPase
MSGQPGTATFLMQLTQQNSALSDARTELEKRCRLAQQELELAQSAETALREHLKDAVDRCDAAEARARALSETATSRVHQLRIELGSTQQAVSELRSQLEDAHKAESAMRVLAVEAEARAVHTTAALETLKASLAAQLAQHDSECNRLRANLATAERVAADARAAEQASHELALEAEHARIRESAAAHTQLAKASAALDAVERERTELLRRLLTAQEAAKATAHVQRDADLQGAAAANLAAQLEAATACIDETMRRQNGHQLDIKANGHSSTMAADAATQTPPPPPVSVPAAATPVTETCAGASASATPTGAVDQTVLPTLGAALVAAAIANVRARAAEEELDEISDELAELKAELEGETAASAAADQWALRAATDLATAEARIEELEARNEALHAQLAAAASVQASRPQSAAGKASNEAPSEGDTGRTQRTDKKQPQCACVIS